jgi:hypothetical protein
LPVAGDIDTRILCKHEGARWKDFKDQDRKEMHNEKNMDNNSTTCYMRVSTCSYIMLSDISRRTRARTWTRAHAHASASVILSLYGPDE